MKKIIIIGPAYPLRGGLAAFNERIARAFIEQGYHVTIYTFALQYPNFLFPGKTQYADDPPPDDLDIRVKINSINPINWWEIGKQIKKLKPDIVLTRYWIPFMAPCLGTMLRIIKKNKLSKIICIVDNIIPHEKRAGDKILTRYFLMPVDVFVAMSHEVVKDLLQFTSKKIAFVPHPVYDNFGAPVDKFTAQQYLQLQPGKKYLLFFGFIRAYKGLDLLLEAMANPAIYDSGIHLIIAGEFYEDKKLYDAIIEKYHLQSKLILHDYFIANNEVKYYFSAADIVVQPYKSATQSGISQIAYHFNKPMIVTNVGGLPEIVPHNKTGYVVAPAPMAIADAIQKFYAENKEAEFVKNVEEEKKKFSWKYMTEKIIELAS